MPGRRPLAALLLLTLAPLVAQARNVNLGDTLARWGYGKDTARADSVGRWSRSGFSVQAEKNSRALELGGVKLFLGESVRADTKGGLYLSDRDFYKTLAPILAPSPDGPTAVRTIMLDPGHGGKDPGKMNPKLGINEKTMALDVVRRLKSILETKGYRVLVTRTRDTFIELDDRAAVANRAKADLFVSIHFNAAGSPSACGLETYCLTPAGQYSTNDAKTSGDTGAEFGNRNDSRNVLLGYYVQKTLVEKLDAEDRGVRRARFAVLREIACPGVLVECGYMSNPAEAARIASPVHREKIAQGVADAITLYHSRVHRLAAKGAK